MYKSQSTWIRSHQSPYDQWKHTLANFSNGNRAVACCSLMSLPEVVRDIVFFEPFCEDADDGVDRPDFWPCGWWLPILHQPTEKSKHRWPFSWRCVTAGGSDYCNATDVGTTRSSDLIYSGGGVVFLNCQFLPRIKVYCIIYVFLLVVNPTVYVQY